MKTVSLVLLCTGLACGGSSAPARTPAPLASIAVTPSTASVAAGATVAFSAAGKDAYGGDVALPAPAWSSSDTTVATVDAASGVATGVKAGGPVTITASAGGKSGTAKLTVGAASSTVTIDWGFGAETAVVSTTVHAGAQVQWHNTDATHSIVPDASPPPSGAGPSGAGTTFGAQTITAAPGTYTYHCGIHPSMHGQLIVQ